MDWPARADTTLVHRIAKMAASFKESFVLILEQDIPAMLQSLSSR